MLTDWPASWNYLHSYIVTKVASFFTSFRRNRKHCSSGTYSSFNYTSSSFQRRSWQSFMWMVLNPVFPTNCLADTSKRSKWQPSFNTKLYTTTTKKTINWHKTKRNETQINNNVLESVDSSVASTSVVVFSNCASTCPQQSSNTHKQRLHVTQHSRTCCLIHVNIRTMPAEQWTPLLAPWN